jgi:hypothetical protein
MKSRLWAGLKKAAGPREVLASLAPLDGAARPSGVVGLQLANTGQVG